MLKQTELTTRKLRIAAFNARLHERSICPANHNVEYANGWYYLDGEPRLAPDITRRARELREDPNVGVFFHEQWNTYVLSPTTVVDGERYPERGSVPV